MLKNRLCSEFHTNIGLSVLRYKNEIMLPIFMNLDLKTILKCINNKTPNTYKIHLGRYFNSYREFMLTT